MARSTTYFGAGALVLGAVLAVPGTASAQQKQVTFNKDVAPIFQAKCQSCHEPGSIGPMSLVNYQDARPWARSIKQRVESRQMPPWHIDRSVGVTHFKNDMSLTDAQVATIVAWVDGGAVEGNPADFKAKIKANPLLRHVDADTVKPRVMTLTQSSRRLIRRCIRRKALAATASWRENREGSCVRICA